MLAMERKRCRLWWPEQLWSRKPSSDLVLFGWYMHSPNSVDIVVAIAVSSDDLSVTLSRLNLLDTLHDVNRKMPLSLQESSTFTIVGYCSQDFDKAELEINNDPCSSCEDHLAVHKNASTMPISCHSVDRSCGQDIFLEPLVAGSFGTWKCACEKLDCSIKLSNQSFPSCGNWIRLTLKCHMIWSKESRWIPELHHMHLNGNMLTCCDVHLVLYEPSIFGSHHYSLSSWGVSEHLAIPLKKPHWLNGLYDKPLLPDVGRVLMALNCASAVKNIFESSLGVKCIRAHFRNRSMLASVAWHTAAVFVASVSTVIYIILQTFHSFPSCGSQGFSSELLSKIWRQTWKNVHLRSCQVLYWPVFLEAYGFSFRPNIEYSHRADLRKHFMWANIAVDVLFGNIFGLILLANVEAISFWVLLIVRWITDNLLRSGCVWLMGVPAGFKLNTELAELLGMISLNTIQIFSTLCFFMGFLLSFSVKGLAVSGMILGLTVPAALCIDALKLATVHVSVLHCGIAFIYSRQIYALTSLWRLFRGRKWNPLRQRLDSYDYTVEQHVVGSLLFTPLLLLIPTTSVFYIFFTILRSTITFICFVMEIIVSVLHATPYAEILLWMVKKRRFPSGIWFEIISHSMKCSTSRDGFSIKGDSLCNLNLKQSGSCATEQPVLLSCLRSNYATLGQIIAPFYKSLFQGVCLSSHRFSAHGILIGQRMPPALELRLPPTMPWIRIPFRDYWKLCRSSVLGCRS